MDSPEISTNARSSRYLIAAVLLAAALLAAAPVVAQEPTPTPAPQPEICTEPLIIEIDEGETYEGALELPTGYDFKIICQGDGNLNYLAYINGLRFSRCMDEDSTSFKSRTPREDTLTIIPRWEPFGASARLTVTILCDALIGGFTLPPVPTPPPYPTLPVTLTQTITGEFGSLGGFQGDGGAIRGSHSGLPLPDVGADASIWLGRANQVINLVTLNKSLLFISGAISLAGMIIGWAIKELRNPKDWEK